MRQFLRSTPPRLARHAALILTLCHSLPQAVASERNGFNVANAIIPRDEIISGGPPRDGIPSIDSPKFVRATEAGHLKDDDIVIGVTRDGVARAYPLRILVWHEVVNDAIAGNPIAVTYCPLCGTSMVFDAVVAGRPRTFGVSGLLYNSDVLLYDRENESLWSQIAMRAVSGPDVGSKLTLLPSQHMTWAAWRDRHPDGQVLSTDTGHRRDYRRDAYASYFSSDNTMFPVPVTRHDLPNKEWVLGVLVNGDAAAYPVSRLPDGEAVSDSVGGERIDILWNAAARHPEVTDSSGKTIPSVMAFWFAWQAFHPETKIWRPALP